MSEFPYSHNLTQHNLHPERTLGVSSPTHIKTQHNLHPERPL